jgi:hypothetical protein
MLGQLSPLLGSYNTAKYGYTQDQASMNQMGGGGNGGIMSILQKLAMGGM